MRKFILFLPFLSLLSACHFSVNNPNGVAAHRALCLQRGCKSGTRELDRCSKEQEDRVKRQEDREFKKSFYENINKTREGGKWKSQEDNSSASSSNNTGIVLPPLPLNIFD